MEDEILNRLTKIYETEAIRVIAFTVCEVALAEGRNYEIYLVFHPLIDKNMQISFFIREDLGKKNPVTLVFLNNTKKIREEKLMRKDIPMPDIVDQNIIEDLKILIRQIDTLNSIFLYIEKYSCLEEIVEWLCDEDIKKRKEKLEQQYAQERKMLDEKFHCSTKSGIEYRRSKAMKINYDFFDKWVLTQPKSKKQRWVIIQNAKVYGLGYTREDAYQMARNNPNYIVEMDRFVTSF